MGDFTQGARLFGVYIRAPDFWKIPMLAMFKTPEKGVYKMSTGGMRCSLQSSRAL